MVFRSKKTLFLLITLACKMSIAADYAVIVNTSNTSVLTQDDVKNIYLAKKKDFVSGTTANPLNHQDLSPIKDVFDKTILGKTRDQLKAYWSKMIFTGRAVPIKQLNSDAEIISNVISDPNSIGYISTANVNDSVKVIFEF